MSGRLDVHVSTVRHRGLLLDKFIPQDREQQTAVLQEVASKPLDISCYKLAFARWEQYWRGRGPNILIVEGTVRNRLAIGLGAESVLENGLRLHFTYGTPIIPGSSLKGLLRHALPDEHKNSEITPRNVEWMLFGTPLRQGAARFHDALWIPDGKSPFSLDVLTPHHVPYMQRTGAPTDSDEPVPVRFLTARGRFLFVAELPNESWRGYLLDLLRDALGQIGAGAKKSAGYGCIDVK